MSESTSHGRHDALAKHASPRTATLDALTEPRTVSEACVSCGVLLAGEFCAACGERRAASRDISLRGFLRHVLRDAFDLDARLFRTFRALITRPGLLTVEYVAGRRRPWLSPFQVFIIANLIFFVAVSVVPLTALTTPLGSQLNGQRYSSYARELVRERFAAEETVDYAGFAARFDFATEQYAKSLVILLVPGLAAIFALLFVRRREPAGKHVVFTLHVVSVLLLLLPLAMLPLLLLPPRIANLADGEGPLVTLMFVTLVPYMYLAARRAYGVGQLQAAAAAVAAFMLLPFVLLAYRFILFLAVFHTI